MFQDSNGCQPLQDGSSNASQSGPYATTATSGGMASYHGSHQRQHSDAFATLARAQPRESRPWQQLELVCYTQPANQPKTFSNCVEATDADKWLMDICKHFECSNVRPKDFVKFAWFQLKDQAAEWYQQYKDSRGGRVITWHDFRRDLKLTTFLKVLLRVSVRSSAI